jgi:hypothetical protein
MDETFFEDVCMLKPTSLSCVPRVWENILPDYEKKLKELKENYNNRNNNNNNNDHSVVEVEEDVELTCLKYFKDNYFGEEIETLGTGID